MAAKCILIKNENGETTGAQLKNGQRSQLFDEIASHPTVGNYEETETIYKNIFSSKITKNQKQDENERKIDPRLQQKHFDSRGQRGKTRHENGAYQTLEGTPIRKGATGVNIELHEVAEKYARENGITFKRQSEYVEVKEERAKRIATAYENMEHNPQDPTVKEAYADLIKQTLAQYKVLKEAGYEFYLFDETNDPYKGNPWNTMRDFRNNKTMGVFATEAGFGSNEKLDVSDNPLLEDTGLKWAYGSVDGPMRTVYANDLFRAVHDAFGHGLEGAGFRAKGEENAWQAHIRLFTGPALGAITSETRGQNSWLNYGPYGEQNKIAKVEDTVFADQKTGLMPEWTWEEGIAPSNERQIPEQKEHNYLFANRANGEVFSSYKDALNTEATEIEIGFLDNSGNFYPIKTIRPSFDETTQKGFVNSFVKQGIIADQKKAVAGTMYHQPAGYTQAAQGINSLTLREQALVNLGWQGFQKTKNGFTFNKVEFDKLKGVNGLLEEEIRTVLERNSTLKESEPSNKLDESELKIRLLDLLNSLGVNVMSISDYVSKYKTKNGTEPGVKALADIANKIVAFQGGEITTEELTEEVAHFIVEGWSQEELTNILRNVHKTAEWNQFSQEYRTLYSSRYQGEELEQAVRREVLGKVLATSLMNNFSVENKPEVQKNIIQKLQDLLQQFFQRVRNKVNQKTINTLDDFTNQVNDLLYENQLSEYLNQENYTDNTFVLYSANKADTEIKGMRADVIQALKIARQNIQKFSRGDATNAADKVSIDRNIKKLQELAEDADKIAQKQTVIELMAIVSTQVNELNATIKETENGERLAYGAEENARFESLTQNLKPLLGTIKENIKNNPVKFKKRDWKKVISTITQTQQEVVDLEGRTQNVLKDVIEKDLVEEIMQKHNLDESYRNHVQAWLNAAKKDTSLFHRHFGQITNSRDPLLGLASDVIERVFNGSNREFVKDAKSFQNKLETLGVTPQMLKQLANKGYLMDRIDHAALEERVQELRAVARLQATGVDAPIKEQIEEVIEKTKNKEIEELDSEQSAKFDNLLEKKLRAIQERPFTDKYYEERDEKYKNLKIDPETKKQIKAYSTTRFGLTSKAKRKDGKIDWSRLSLSEEEQLHALNRRRKKDSSVTNSDGTLKTGLSSTTDVSDVPQKNVDEKTVVKIKDVWYYISDNKTQDNIEAQIAIDLIKLDNQYREDITKDGETKPEVPQSFIDEVTDIEANQGKEAALRFIEANTAINFSQEFWDEVSGEKSYLDKVLEASINLEEVKRLGILSIVSNIKKLNNKRSNTMKQFRRQGKPYETDASKMGAITKEAIRELDESLQREYADLSNLVKVEESGEEIDPIHRNDPNEAYLAEVEEEDMNTEEELEFIFNNSTSTARDRVARFKRGIKRYLEGETKALTPAQAEFVKNSNITNIEANNKEDAYTIAYARTQVASYYKKLIPEEATEVFKTKEVGTAVNYLNTLIAAEYVDVQPNYSFLEEEHKYKNKSFDPNYEGGIQPKKGGEFESKEYIKMFAPDANGEATKNKKMFDALEQLKELQRKTLKNYNLSGKHNLYKLPQTTKKGVDRSVDFIKRIGKGGARQALAEMTTYRKEDIAYGETINGENISTIPTYFVTDIENSGELTDELYYSYALMYQQSVLHKHRRNGIGEMLAIKDAIGKRDQPKGKSVETTNTIRMFKNYMDYAIFGVQESQELRVNVFGHEIDMTKMARMLLSFVKFRNLAFSPIVAATSWFTGEVNFQIEKHVKEIINPSSERLGRKEFFKLASDAMKEVGEFQSKSKLNTLGEHFGIYELSRRFEGSNYNWAARNTKLLGFGLHQMANFPISPRAMLAVLHDYRVTDKEIITNFANYKINRKTENAKLTTKEIEQEWKQFEDKVAYNYLEVKDGNVSFRDGIKSELDDSLDKDQYLQDKMEAMTKGVKNAVTKLDQQITSAQRVAAQRHFAMNYLMTHRSWLSIMISNRTKNAHYNLNSGEHEEGSYRSFYHMAQKAIVGLAKDKNTGILKDLWNGKDLEPNDEVSFERLLETRRRNLRRVLLDSVWVMGLAGIAYALMAFTDDEDEDNYALQLTSYLSLRVLNETASSSTALPLQFYEVLKSPFVGLNTLKDLVTLVPNAINSEPVKSGAFKGYTSFEKNLVEVLPGLNVVQDINNIQDTKDTYWFYNSSNVKWTPAALFEVSFGEDKK